MIEEKRKTAKDFPQELLELYDYYAHGQITKRQFLERAGKFAVGTVTASVLLSQLSPDYLLAQQVSPDDESLDTQRISYASPNGHESVNGYLVRPAAISTPLPAILVIHENRGLNPYIEDVTRRLGKAGFMALAPDGLTSVGGYPGTDDAGKELQAGLDRVKLMNDFFAGFEHLLARQDGTKKVGAIGFCYGGGVVNAIAVAYPELAAGVPFYGRQPEAKDVAAIKAPLMLQYAELDRRINEGWPAYEEALKAAGVDFVAHMYASVNHGFHNDTTPRYDEKAAKLAEQRSIDFFKQRLA